MFFIFSGHWSYSDIFSTFSWIKLLWHPEIFFNDRIFNLNRSHDTQYYQNIHRTKCTRIWSTAYLLMLENWKSAYFKLATMQCAIFTIIYLHSSDSFPSANQSIRYASIFSQSSRLCMSRTMSIHVLSYFCWNRVAIFLCVGLLHFFCAFSVRVIHPKESLCLIVRWA